MMPKQAWLPSAMAEGAPAHLLFRGELCGDTQAKAVPDSLHAAHMVAAGQQEVAACSNSSICIPHSVLMSFCQPTACSPCSSSRSHTRSEYSKTVASCGMDAPDSDPAKL